MKLECNLAKVRKHGFLTMYEMISGYGAWCRYWFYLNGDKLSFWKYPEQETSQVGVNFIVTSGKLIFSNSTRSFLFCRLPLVLSI